PASRRARGRLQDARATRPATARVAGEDPPGGCEEAMTYGSRRQDLEEIAESGQSMGGGAGMLEGQREGAPAPAVRRRCRRERGTDGVTEDLGQDPQRHG